VAPAVSQLDGWPACAPVHASPTLLPTSAHDSGSRWFATGFLYGSFLRYSLPALTGAFGLSPISLLRPNNDSLHFLVAPQTTVTRGGSREWLIVLSPAESRLRNVPVGLPRAQEPREALRARNTFEEPGTSGKRAKVKSRKEKERAACGRLPFFFFLFPFPFFLFPYPLLRLPDRSFSAWARSLRALLSGHARASRSSYSRMEPPGPHEAKPPAWP